MDNNKEKRIFILNQKQLNYCDIKQDYQNLQLNDYQLLVQGKQKLNLYQRIRPYLKRLILFVIILLTSILLFLQTYNVSQQKKPLENPNEQFFQNNWLDITDQIIKPKTIKSKFESIKLKENNLKVLLISEPNLPLSAASLDVKVGSFNNPDQLQGLAHLLEHMLFMGSEKYQDDNLFFDLISRNGGQANAFTANGNTNYYFQSTNNNFEQLLEVWSRFFIDPLLKEDQLEREIQAVDSEYVNSLTDEANRIYELLVNISDKQHPINTFGCGNFDSLMKNPKNTYFALREFLQKFYFAENMTLVVKSKKFYVLRIY
ncbi:m16 family protein, putative [Ichthyophthirius multifiliis]|uniref:M16 family protein, putative n=1 Tax=Ichthyophthirius multifiliis TaxID=5932 RepID=G0QW80_ICHMU|nr:m16 family protein, putative [Ichthyophthirius multifiliis]EGR30535.1 m16 family protein, putative [Ichthyophthirius multifiliis]|eukprot:XP_004032122.1 m16 family protein, putative [Ichthyophthirius multifiliis]